MASSFSFGPFVRIIILTMFLPQTTFMYIPGENTLLFGSQLTDLFSLAFLISIAIFLMVVCAENIRRVNLNGFPT